MAEVKVPLADGSFFWIELSAYPLKDDNGNIKGIIGRCTLDASTALRCCNATFFVLI